MSRLDPGSCPSECSLDGRIIRAVRQGLPLVEQPYLELAGRLEISEERLLKRLQELKSRQLLSFLGPVYFAEAFGRGLSLLAMSVAEEDTDRIKQILSRFPEVVHLISCRHHFNLWFTLTAPGLAAKERLHRQLQAETGYTIIHLHSLQEFYQGHGVRSNPEPAATALSEFDWRLIAASEQGLPLVSRPYLELARQLAISQDELLVRMQRLNDRGVLLRVAGIPNYCRAGYRACGISIWDIEDRAIDQVGEAIAALPLVSQCSLRPRQPGWPYNLMVTLHGRNRGEVRQQVEEIADLTKSNLRAHDVVFRSHMWKKTRHWPIQGIL